MGTGMQLEGWEEGVYLGKKKKINLQELSVLVLGFFIPKLILSKL